MQVLNVPKFTVDIIVLTTAMNRGVSVVTVYSLLRLLTLNCILFYKLLQEANYVSTLPEEAKSNLVRWVAQW